MAHKLRETHARWRNEEVGEKLPAQGWARVCAVYPDAYAVAMANLGYQWLMHALAEAGLAMARVVWPERDLFDEARRDTLPAIDDDRPAREAAAWFVSLSFENDLPRLAGLLHLAGMSPLASERQPDDPLIVVGGVVPTLNPEPVAALADVCLLGEGHAALDPFIAYWQANENLDRETFLLGLRELPNAYVGRYYQPHYRADGRLDRIVALAGFPERVRVAKEKKVDPLATRTHLRAPSAAFGDALLIETGRGCIQRCRFCAAGHLFLPYRPASPPSELPDLQHGVLGLVGANVSGHSKLAEWLGKAGTARTTLSSIRVGAFDETGWADLAARGLAAAAIAPEAGSERLRHVLNKPLTDEEILREVRLAIGAGLRNLKLYFLIGLPTETDADIDDIVNLSVRCRETAMERWKEKGRAGKIVVSVNPLIPKPHTPFQWQPFGEMRDLKKKLKRVREGLRREANLELQAESLDASLLQALLSIGDRRTAELILAVDREGLRPALRAWQRGENPAPTYRYELGDALPWDHIETGITRKYLRNEYEAAQRGETSAPCCTTPNCRLCGACE